MPEDLLAGRIVFGDDAVPFEGASIDVQIEDTTQADAPARVRARVTLRAVSFDGAAGGHIPFSIRCERAAPGRQNSLRVLVDLDGDGHLGPGDYGNAESVPLLPNSVAGLVVRVRRVR